MTPAGCHQAIQGLLNAIPDLRGVSVLDAYHPAPPDGDASPWLRLSVRHLPGDHEPDDFGTPRVYQQVRVEIDCNSIAHNPERAWEMAESVRSALAGNEEGELRLEHGTFQSLDAPAGNWATLRVLIEGEYEQEG